MAQPADRQSFDRYLFLRMVLTDAPELLTTLTDNGRHALDDFYQPDLALTVEDLAVRQAEIAARRPELHASAGRFFKKLEATYYARARAFGLADDAIREQVSKRLAMPIRAVPESRDPETRNSAADSAPPEDISRTSNDTNFLERHYRLKAEWNGGGGGAFSWIDPGEQWALHHFFLPYKDVSDDELIAHRHAITQKRPELPEEADHAYQRLSILMDRPKPVPQPTVSFSGKKTKRPKKSERVISVRALVRPEIDMQKLARALIEFARDQEAKDLVAGRTKDDEPPQ